MLHRAGGGFGDQLSWLEADLKNAHEDSAVDWIVVVGHRPIYQSIEDLDDWPVNTVKKCRTVFEPLFHQYGVDLYVGAHKHYYERIAPAFEGKADPDGTVQVINGAAGNNEGVDKGKGNGGLVVASNYVSNGFCELSAESNDLNVSNVVLRLRYVLSTNGTVFDEIALPSRRVPKSLY